MRVLSGLVLGPATLGIVGLGGWAFLALVAVGAVIAVGEWLAMVVPGPARTVRIGAVIALAVVLAATLVGGPAAGLAAAVAGGLAVQAMSGAATPIDRLWVFLAVPYVAAGAAGLLWLRGLSEVGLPLLLYLLAIIWATDIAAFLVGREVQGPRLWRDISPSKTWAGLAGGAAAAGVAGGLVAGLAGAHQPLLAVALALALAVVGQAGDLFESALKRRYKVKDSGTLIPGHGGLLDRVDGLIAAAPVLALFHATVGASIGWW